MRLLLRQITAIATVCALSSIALANQPRLKPRLVPPKSTEVRHNEEYSTLQRLIVKFAEGSDVRNSNGEFFQRSVTGSTSAHAIDVYQLNNTLKARPALLRKGAFRIERLFSRSEAELEASRKTGMEKSHEELADLNLYHVIVFDGSVPTEEIRTLANAVIKLGVVETAYFEPKPQLTAFDIAPATPSFEHKQNYLDQAFSSGANGCTLDPYGYCFNGIDARYAWTFPGGRGAGMKFIDIEHAWNTNHEDLNGPTLAREADINPNDRYHGTAALGIINAQPNGYGMTGIASDSIYGLVTYLGAAAYERAASFLQPGNVILLELGNMIDYSVCGGGPEFRMVPLEHFQADFDAIKSITATGIIVVEPAGNGYINLDAPCMGNLYNPAYRDSGAIMVGASWSRGPNRVWFSNYSARVDVRAQGEVVATTVTDYGDLFPINPPDENQGYTSWFNGTSSASAIVAGAVLSLQGIQKARNGNTFSPSQMRSLLKTFGTPGVPGELIGPMPNLRTTIDWMLADVDGDGMSNGDEFSSGRNPNVAEYLVTATALSNGAVTPSSQYVTANGSASVTTTPAPGYVPAVAASTCSPGNFSGNTYTTGPIQANCVVNFRFNTVPDSPTLSGTVVGDGLAFISFNAPSNSGGLPVDFYTATCMPGNMVAVTASSPAIVTGLGNGISYTCSVAATNAIGAGSPSTPVAVSPGSSALFQLGAVRSRKTHGTAGTYDITIDQTQPIGGAVTVESRLQGTGHNLVFQFTKLVASFGAVAVLGPTGAPVGTATTSCNGNELIVAITGVPDISRASISVTGVNGTTSVSSSIGFLVGDVNNSRGVTSSDISGVKARTLLTTTHANFRYDVNSDGRISSSDISITKSRSLQSLP